MDLGFFISQKLATVLLCFFSLSYKVQSTAHVTPSRQHSGLLCAVLLSFLFQTYVPGTYQEYVQHACVARVVFLEHMQLFAFASCLFAPEMLDLLPFTLRSVPSILVSERRARNRPLRELPSMLLFVSVISYSWP